MNTEILDGKNDADLKRAAEILKNGGIVAIPTETVYGLAASAYDFNAIKNVFVAKGRPQDNPLIVHVSSKSMLNDVVKSVPEIAERLADKFWPGPLTMILERNNKISKSVSAGLSTVAVRCPDNDIALKIIELSNLPLAAPSANLSGAPSPTTAQHVINDLSGKVDAIVVGNDCKIGVESTVISLGNSPKLLRPGAVTVEELKEFLPDIEVDKAVLNKLTDGQKVSSPGMKYKHYSPKTETFLVEGSNKAFADFVNKKKNAAAVCFCDEYPLINIQKISYGSRADESTLAKNVFSVLRSVDELSVNEIYVHAPSKTGVGLAVYNRLVRAAAFRVIKL